MIEHARGTVFVQSQSVSSPATLSALTAAAHRGVEVKVLLGPKPDYVIQDAKVQVGSHPYAANAGTELAALSAAGVRYFINPRFNELRATRVVPGVESRASYLIAGDGLSLVCSGALSSAALVRERNFCVRSTNRERAFALATLFTSEFEELPAERRDAYEHTASKQLLICPGCEADLVRAFGAEGTLYLRISGIGTVPTIETALRHAAARLRVLLPKSYQNQNPFVDELVRAGARVRYVPQDYDGLLLVTETLVLAGSVRLDAGINHSRQVAVREAAIHKWRRFFEQEWEQAE